MMVFHAVLERKGLPPMEEEPIISFVNSVRQGANSLEA